MLEDRRVIEFTGNFVDSFQNGYLEGAMGYKFRTKTFLDVIFLYINSVDTSNPDILGKTNKNTFIYEGQDAIRKIKEQVGLDTRDMNFLIHGASSLPRHIVKAANRKTLKDNDFDVEMDAVEENGVDFGSGFLKVWKNSDGDLRMRSVDPYDIIFDQYNFAKGAKVERLRRSYREIIADEKYRQTARDILAERFKTPEEREKQIVLYQLAKPNPDGGYDIYVVDTENELVYYSHEGNEDIDYFKWDYQRRRGFPDALGVGANEQIFNIIVQNKVNRERMDDVMRVASKLPLQKKIDNERDKIVGKNIGQIKTGEVMGYRNEPIAPMELGGVKQVEFINSQLAELTQKGAEQLNMNDALQGNTLPSGTSGVLGNLLTENASSVHKEVQDSYAKFLSNVYDKRVTPYILSIFDREEDIERHLDPNDARLVRENVINYLTLQKQIDAEIEGRPFNIAEAREEVKQELTSKKLISGDLLDRLKEEVQGIETFITGEKKSKAQTVAFLREVRKQYQANPEVFQQPFYVELLKKEAEYENGISGLEIDNLLKELEQ